MRHSTLLGIVFVGVTALSGVACSNSGSTESTGEGQSAIRSVRGHLKSGTAATSVVATAAEADGQESKTYSAAVDAQGNFRLTLPKGARYVVGLVDGDNAIATLQFASGAGGELTSLLPVADPPARAHRERPTDESEDDIDLGEVDESEGGCDHNPLDQVDWDRDGESDYADADDDDDGTADADDEDSRHHHGGPKGKEGGDEGRGDECEDGGDGEGDHGGEGEPDDDAGGDEGAGGGEGEPDDDAGGDEGAGGGEVIEVPSPG
ncbi:hypothetical protein WME91_34345 [Sorangium sp. So ce269]